MNKRFFHIRVELVMIETENGYEAVNADWAFGKYDSKPGTEQLLDALKTAAKNEINQISFEQVWPNIELQKDKTPAPS